MATRAVCFCTLLICLCSACARPPLPKAPEPVELAACTRPAVPALPKLSGLEMLESAKAYALLKRRDRVMRDYISGLESAVNCYEMQLPKVKN